MKRLFLYTIIFGLLVLFIAIIAITHTPVEPTEDNSFLHISNYEIIAESGKSLFLSVTVDSPIPESKTDFGYVWLYHNSTTGYITNIHSTDSWHSERISIDINKDTNSFCFDDIIPINSNVMINSTTLNAVIHDSADISFDKVISYTIIPDESCHYGYAGIILDEMVIR